jgi:S-adenosylmethionine:tRNA ribosyltransferase-isomerase
MISELRLNGVRVRNETTVRVEVLLHSKVGSNSWRAHIRPAGNVQVGDRLRFGDTSENPACFLSFLDADIVEKIGDRVLLAFHFTGAALDDALDRLGETHS